jgi:hypothetical protein
MLVCAHAACSMRRDPGSSCAAECVPFVFNADRALLSACGTLLSVCAECSVLRADLALLCRVPHGRLLSRFSTDSCTIDDHLPFVANICIASTAGFVAVLAVMLVCQPLLLLLVFPLGLFYVCTQHAYRCASRRTTLSQSHASRMPPRSIP